MWSTCIYNVPIIKFEYNLFILLNHVLKGKLTEIATLVRLKNSELSEDSQGNSGCISQVAGEIKHVNKNINIIN